MRKHNFLKTACLFMFTLLCLKTITLAAIEVIAVSPEGRTAGMDYAATITVTFNKPMVALGKLPEGEGTGLILISPEVKGKFRWMGTSTLSFTPAVPLPLATEFEVTVPEGIKSDVSGEFLEREYKWKFETMRPDLLYSYPREKQDWLELDENIFLVFNQEMEPRNIREYISISEKDVDGNATYIDFNARHAVEQDSITFRVPYQWYRIGHATKTHTIVLIPQKGLKKDCFYSLELARGLKTKEGDLGLYSKRTIQFATYKTFMFVRFASWDALEPSVSLEFVFTNPVRISDLLNALTIEPKIEFPEHYSRYDNFSHCNADCQCCPVSFSIPLKPCTTYFVKIAGSLSDKY